jgi:hypothetical protein
MIEGSLRELSMWLDDLLLIGLCILSAEAGRLIHRRLARGSSPSTQKSKEVEGYLFGSIFGLFAFIIAFAFSMAVDRFEDRRKWVAEEANAINTAYSMAQLFDEDHRTQLQLTLRDYARTRIAPDGRWNDEMERQLSNSQHLRGQFWEKARLAAYSVRQSDLGPSFMQAAADVVNIGRHRELAARVHIPDRIMYTLLSYLIVVSGVLGFLSADQSNRFRLASVLLFALMAVAIVLIIDLDHPTTGSIRVPQTPIVELVDGMRS